MTRKVRKGLVRIPPDEISAEEIAAHEALERRQAENAEKTKIDNASLPAGSPMHYYCRVCGGLSDVLPEEHISAPRRLCAPCQEMKDKGWLKPSD
jgi:hypothetical protein